MLLVHQIIETLATQGFAAHHRRRNGVQATTAHEARLDPIAERPVATLGRPVNLDPGIALDFESHRGSAIGQVLTVHADQS